MHKTYDYSPYDRATPLGTDYSLGDQLALNHFRAHIGEPRWDALVYHAQHNGFPTKEFFRDTCAIMLEVEGRPVEAFIRKYLAELPETGTPLVLPLSEVAGEAAPSHPLSD